MVEEIKKGQRSDAAFNHAWRNFCEDNNAARMRDPATHDKSFLESFVSSYSKAPTDVVLSTTSIQPRDSDRPEPDTKRKRWVPKLRHT